MDNLFKLLMSIYPLSQELINYLRANLEIKELKRGDFLLKKSRICTHIYFIESGCLRCFYEKNGAEATSWLMTEGNVIVSVSSFFNQKESRESIQAMEDTVVIGISFEKLEYINRTYIEFNFHGRVLSQKYYAISDDQLYAIKMQRAPERYLHLLETQPELFDRVPAKYIASLLGISEPTLSRVRKKYKRK